jgi:hypothetical protein
MAPTGSIFPKCACFSFSAASKEIIQEVMKSENSLFFSR